MLNSQKLAQSRYRYKIRVRSRTDSLYNLVDHPPIELSLKDRDELVDYIFTKLSGLDE